MSQAVIILQARMASSRLPGKVLREIGARTLLGHCVERLRIGSAAPILLATTTNPEDDVLVEAAAAEGIDSFRGPDRDVLLRFVQAAQYVGARFVVRATADNPAIEIDGAERLLRLLRSTGVDYAIEDGLPHGANVEAMTTEALLLASQLATDRGDREHVTPFIRRERNHFTALGVPAPIPVRRPDLRVTVDTEHDLWFMQQLAERMNDWNTEPELVQIIRAIDALAVESQCA